MASGRSHDRATTLLAVPFGLLWWPAAGSQVAVAAAAAFAFGGLWLSPDLDTRSNATRRWGPLALLWWPYRHLLSHRSLLSHGPLIGSAVRLAWLMALVALMCASLQPLGGPAPAQLAGALGAIWQSQRPLLLAALVGLEASSWLHLLQDGDPLPRLPRPLRRLLPRRKHHGNGRIAIARTRRPRTRSSRRVAR